MADKKKYYNLDDVRVIGKQEKKTSLSRKYHEHKTGEIFRTARTSAASSRKIKKAS